jgi:hypothetical protein
MTCRIIRSSATIRTTFTKLREANTLRETGRRYVASIRVPGPVSRAIAALDLASDGMNLYELRITERAGRKSNALNVALEVRL